MPDLEPVAPDPIIHKALARDLHLRIIEIVGFFVLSVIIIIQAVSIANTTTKLNNDSQVLAGVTKTDSALIHLNRAHYDETLGFDKALQQFVIALSSGDPAKIEAAQTIFENFKF